MKQYEVPLETGKYYHIYNRGINGTNLFFEERNYLFFLEKYSFYMSKVLETYAYCLLGNHFHLLVKVKDNLNLDLTGFKNTVVRNNTNKHFFVYKERFRIYNYSLNFGPCVT